MEDENPRSGKGSLGSKTISKGPGSDHEREAVLYSNERHSIISGQEVEPVRECEH